jgi:hypothetical protein
LHVIPAQAGIQIVALDSRLRGNDRNKNTGLYNASGDRSRNAISKSSGGQLEKNFAEFNRGPRTIPAYMVQSASVFAQQDAT